MRNVSIILCSLLLASVPVTAFVPSFPRTARQVVVFASTIDTEDPEVQAAIEQVRKCAANFSEETAHFANVWIENMLEGKKDKTPAGLLEECILDDDACNCQDFDAALKKLSSMMGVGSSEQF